MNKEVNIYKLLMLMLLLISYLTSKERLVTHLTLKEGRWIAKSTSMPKLHMKNPVRAFPERHNH